MKKEVIVINGSGGVGKDTVIEMCQETIKVKNISSVDKIKEAARVLGWDGTKTEKARKMLSDLKQLSIDYNDGPIKYMIDEYTKFQGTDEEIMFVHIREPEEIQKLVNLIGCKTLLVTSSRIDTIKTNKSDASVFDYNYDYQIKNDGTLEDLQEEVSKFISDLKKTKQK